MRTTYVILRKTWAGRPTKRRRTFVREIVGVVSSSLPVRRLRRELALAGWPASSYELRPARGEAVTYCYRGRVYDAAVPPIGRRHRLELPE